MGKNKTKKLAAAKAQDQAAYYDAVVMTNVYADFHRIMQDRLDNDFSTPASANEFAPAEIARRASYALLDDVADSVALKWKNFEPNPEAGWSGDSLEVRGQAIQGFKQALEDEVPDQAARIRTEMIETYQDRRKVGTGLTEEILTEAVDKGLTKGQQVINEMIEWLEQDEPSRNYPQAYLQRGAAIETCWEITCRHVKRRIPKKVKAPKDIESLYRLAYLDVAQKALHQAFNLVASGVVDPDNQPKEAPRLFAGSIMTALNIPQDFIDPGPDEEEAALMKKEGYAPVPTPINGEVAESPQAVQTRELMIVFNAISDDLLVGELRRDVKRRFKEMAELSFAPDESAAKLDLKVGKKVKAAAADEADKLVDNILADMVVEMKAQDGWRIDRSTLKTAEDKMALSPPPKFTFMPHTATVQ